MDDGQQRDCAGNRLLAGLSCSPERLQLAAVGAVEDLPPAVAKPLTYRIRGVEIALPTALDALVEQLLS